VLCHNAWVCAVAAMGVRKPVWYFMVGSFWGFGAAEVADVVEEVEAATDEDVLAEEAALKARANAPPHPESSIEVRGLVAEFRRGGKPLLAVKAPWFGVRKKQLLALLGPNGAGKTTTVNMLTGFIPPSRGNALVAGKSIAHPLGMSAVRRIMGVCPQFDTLWASLTAREHLELFACIKGVEQHAIALEAMRRIEEVHRQTPVDLHLHPPLYLTVRHPPYTRPAPLPAISHYRCASPTRPTGVRAPFRAACAGG
jgi:ABC-type glutathione transport system ATPase component